MAELKTADKIGVTERGDAGIDLSWIQKLRTGTYDGAILITKIITPGFTKGVQMLHKAGFPLVVHAGCTGWGQTPMEPKNPVPEIQLKNAAVIRDLIGTDRTVIRVDPIIPTPEGIARAEHAITAALALGFTRFRISIFDNYRHAAKRIADAGYPELYGGKFSMEAASRARVQDLLARFPNTAFEACAEKDLAAPNLVHTGCVGERDLSLMGLAPSSKDINRQNRFGCLCLACKTELLTHRCQCPNGCLYCYWHDAE